MKKISAFLVLLAMVSYAVPVRFLGIDESRGQLIYVNTKNAAENWALKLPEKCRDYQMLSPTRLLLNGRRGYYEMDLPTKTIVKTVARDEFGGTMSCRRTKDGKTLLAALREGGTVIFELDANDNVLRKAVFPGRNSLRLMRESGVGTMYSGGPEDTLTEVDMTGKVIRETKIPGGRHVYQGERLPNGNLLVSSGYGGSIVEFDTNGKEIRRLHVKDDEKARGIVSGFFAGMEILKDGSIVVSNWTGHGANDSEKGQQLLMFAPDGKIVWTWHDAKLAGTLHGVIILEND